MVVQNASGLCRGCRGRKTTQPFPGWFTPKATQFGGGVRTRPLSVDFERSPNKHWPQGKEAFGPPGCTCKEKTKEHISAETTLCKERQIIRDN